MLFYIPKNCELYIEDFDSMYVATIIRPVRSTLVKLTLEDENLQNLMRKVSNACGQSPDDFKWLASILEESL